MSLKMMVRVLEESESTGNDRLVLFAIADHADDEGANAWPSLATLSRKSRASLSTVRRCIQHLVELNELIIEEQGTGKRSTHYRIVLNEGGQSDHPEVNEGGQSDHPELSEGGQSEHPGCSPVATLGVHPWPPNSPLTVLEENPPTPQADPFEVFWLTYPRHEAKAKAKVAYAKATTHATPEEILAGATRYRDDPNRLPEFTAHPSTWLNQQRWDDDPLPARRDGGHMSELGPGVGYDWMNTDRVLTREEREAWIAQKQQAGA